MRRYLAMLAVLCLFAFPDGGKAQEGSPFLNLDAGACETLDDINLQVGPPDEEIVAACAKLHARSVLGQRFPANPGALALLIIGMGLTYAVLGAPARAIAEGIERKGARRIAGAAVALFGRAAIGLLFLAILAIPFAAPAACLVALAATILAARPTPAAPVADDGRSHAGSFLADAINDLYASGPGILGLALLARRDPRWLMAGIALAIVASIPRVIAARRRLRREPFAIFAAAVALAALLGVTASADANFSHLLGDEFEANPAIMGAIAFAAAALGMGWWAHQPLRVAAQAKARI